MDIKLTFLGHSAFLLHGSKKIIIDPFITGNPVAKIKLKDIDDIDYVLVTHDHEDHIGDAFKIAKKTKAKVVAIHEVVNKYFPQKEGVTTEKVIGMNIGGTFVDGDIEISMTLAFHSSYVGHPAGFVVSMDNKKIYHAGDTSYFSDMKFIGDKFKLDAALLPIGGHYTMHEEDAAMAVKTLKAKLSIPMHYNTWPLISADPEKFSKLCKTKKIKILDINESITI